MRRQHPLQHGMTLVEMIVAISVLIFAVLGPVSLAIGGLHAAKDAQKELAAIYLASEAIEIVHNYRDNNSALDYSAPTLHNQWLNGISPACTGANGCIVDSGDRTAPMLNGIWGANTFTACATAGCVGGASREDEVYLNPNTDFYRQKASGLSSPWQKTGMRRRVYVTVGGAGHAQVNAVVDYPGTRGLRTVTLTDDLHNWFFSF